MAGKSTISITFKLDGDGKGFRAIAQDANGLRTVMASTLEQSEALKTSLVNWSAAVQGLQGVDKAINQIASQLNSITSESEEFNKAMKMANTMAGKDSAGFKELKGEIAELAKEIPIARDQLANGLYQTISNGVPEDNWIEFLNTSARSAVGGIADINKVVGVTSTLIKNYGLEWSAAADIQDKIQLTAKNGVTSFEQLAQALPKVTGNAATLDVSIDELMGTFATLTGVSGNTAEVSTQLGAIFTALVKPSSEAAKMAAEMGIQFDAAAIKAAGGFQNFLNQLDSSVKAYAQANGVLEQEIYSKLFGSAEAVRALIPLQGELADKFTANVDSMVNSAGTMDAAYADMSSHGEAVNQMLRNQWAVVIDVIDGVTSAAQPYINFTAGLLSTGSSAATLIITFKQLNIQQVAVATRAKLASAAMVTLGLRGKSAAAVVRIFSSAMKGGAYSATALKIALRGLLISTGIGIAIAALTAVIEYFVSSTDDATESTNKFLDAEERAKREAEQLDQLRKQEASTLTNTRAALEINISKLKEFNGTKEQEKKLVNEMNATYGNTMGYFSSVSDWYKALISNSEAYCRQMVIEARQRMLANQIAEKEQEAHDIIYDDTGKKRRYSKQRDTKTVISGTTNIGGEVVPTWETKEIPGTSDLEKANAAIRANKAEVANLRQQMKSTAKEAAEVTFSVKGSAKQPKTTTTKTGKTGGKSVTKKEKSQLQQLNDLITNAQERYITASETEREEIRKNITEWNNKRRAIEILRKQSERPTDLTSFQDIDDEIAYQQTLRRYASQENLAGIDAEIKRLGELRHEMERSSHIPVPIEEISTYEQLNGELARYNDLLTTATATERVEIQQQINALTELKNRWDNVLADLKKPGDVSALNTIAELDEAINYYQQKQKKATGEEIQNIQLTINAYEKKRNALQRGIEIPSMQHEVAEINKLTGREYKVKISGMGFDELTAKINELNRLLNDLDHPVTATQRKDIESLIATYEKWRKEGINAFETFRNGWGSIKGIGDGVESITDALEGNGNAWQTVTGIVDGFLQIYDGIKTIVGIINMLSVATTAHTTAKTAESVAMGVATGAQTAEAVAAETNAAAQIPVIAANKLATASYMELAAAAYFAAHASIPFAGFGIASGFVTAATAMVQAIGVMPFANGGIVSGPTVGLIGEYAGASNNPEVVAPLDKLRGMLNPAGEPVIIGGTLRAAGREIICVLANETRIASKSGKRTNIKL